MLCTFDACALLLLLLLPTCCLLLAWTNLLVAKVRVSNKPFNAVQYLGHTQQMLSELTSVRTTGSIPWDADVQAQ